MNNKHEYISDLPHGQPVLFYAFRYALGRMTYITDTISCVLIREWPNLDLQTKVQIQKEIREAIEHDLAGMSYDIKKWQKVLELEV